MIELLLVLSLLAILVAYLCESCEKLIGCEHLIRFKHVDILILGPQSMLPLRVLPKSTQLSV